jgi:hypothetical protein
MNDIIFSLRFARSGALAQLTIFLNECFIWIPFSSFGLILQQIPDFSKQLYSDIYFPIPAHNFPENQEHDNYKQKGHQRWNKRLELRHGKRR